MIHSFPSNQWQVIRMFHFWNLGPGKALSSLLSDRDCLEIQKFKGEEFS